MSEAQNPGSGDPAGRYDPSATPFAQAAPPYAPGQPPGGRPRIPDTTPVYTWFIWVLAFIDLLGIVTSTLATPTYRFREIDGIRTLDPTSVFTPGYFAGLVLALVIYALSIVFSYLDRRELQRRGVERPFHWAWAFLASPVYIIGRSVIVHRVASPRGLAPIWAWVATFVVRGIVVVALIVPRLLDILQNLPTYPR